MSGVDPGTSRVTLVTGAARGQGLAIVRRLRRDSVRVVAGDVLADLRAEVSTLDDDGVTAVELDITSPRAGTGALEVTTADVSSQVAQVVSSAPDVVLISTTWPLPWVSS